MKRLVDIIQSKVQAELGQDRWLSITDCPDDAINSLSNLELLEYISDALELNEGIWVLVSERTGSDVHLPIDMVDNNFVIHHIVSAEEPLHDGDPGWVFTDTGKPYLPSIFGLFWVRRS